MSGRGLGFHSCSVAPGCFPDRAFPGMPQPAGDSQGLELLGWAGLSVAAPLALGEAGALPEEKNKSFPRREAT